MQKGNKKAKISPGLKLFYTTLIVLALLVAVILVLVKVDFSPNKKEKKAIRTIGIDTNNIVQLEKFADTKLNMVKFEMTKPTNTYKFLVKDINTAEDYTWRALNLDTTLSTSWERLGYIYSHLHGDQALKRYKSYSDRGISDKADIAEGESLEYFIKANLYYNLALEYGSPDSANVYLQMAQSLEFQGLYEQAALLIQKSIEADPGNRKYEAALIRALLFGGRFDQALFMNKNYMNKYPESDIPYLNLAMYHYNQGDTLATIDNYEKAVLKGTKPEASKFLYRYFTQHGDSVKADYYTQKARQAIIDYDPERY